MKRSLSVLMALALVAGASVLSAGENPTIPPGTLLRIRLDTTITSKTNKPGDTFRGLLTQDVLSGEETIVARGSIVEGHVAFLKPAGRIKAKAQMRIVLDSLLTPEDQKIMLSSTLEDTRGGVCGSTANDEEGTIVGCGKSKKDAAKDAGIGAAMGAGAGATVGIGAQIDCRYYGNCGGPGMAGNVLYGAAIGATTALIYNIFKRQKEIILLSGSELIFVVNRTAERSTSGPPREAAQPPASASTNSDQ